MEYDRDLHYFIINILDITIKQTNKQNDNYGHIRFTHTGINLNFLLYKNIAYFNLTIRIVFDQCAACHSGKTIYILTPNYNISGLYIWSQIDYDSYWCQGSTC